MENKNKRKGLLIKILKRYSFILLIAIFIISGWFLWNYLMSIGVNLGYKPLQPMSFSHKTHSGINEMDCLSCHYGAAKGEVAGLPSINECMNCHKFISKAKSDTTGEIGKIYKSINFNFNAQSFGDSIYAMKWTKVNDLPDLARFNHTQHVTIAGLDCIKCHGDVKTMDKVEQTQKLTMGWCIECHRTSNVTDEKKQVYYKELINKLKNKYKKQKITVEEVGGLECGKCHY